MKAISEHDLTVYQGDVREQLAALEPGSAQCVVTSPPYYGLRDYGVDGQIGLEASPAEYVAELVGVFREVRRVLADDGVAWLNLGDSYANGSPGGTQGTTGQRASRTFTAVKSGGCTALPPKNLLGIPWQVARAMQEPYYTGKIRNEADRAWLAAIVDGEGCIAVHRRPAGSSQYRRNDTFAPMVQISNTNLPLIERCVEIAGGVGSVSHSDRGRNRRIYRYCFQSNDARALLRELYPYLVAKRAQARAAYSLPSSGPDAERAWLEIKALNKGGTHDGGWPVPPSPTEPGWILRNAVVWSKTNAMPESVTDRLSTRYEHVFLLSKSRRYWFDLDAIREPAADRSDLLTWEQRKETGQCSRRSNRGVRVQAGERATFAHPEAGKNPGDVWTVATSPFPGAHFAAMPPQLARRCILAGCPQNGTVLDPFAGSGTTLMVARKLGRKAVGVELNPDYIDIIRQRIGQTPLDFGEATA